MTLAEVQSRYDADAAAYIRWWAPVLRAAMQPLLDDTVWDGDRTVLEIGCGTGLLLDDIAARAPAAHIVGVDASFGMLRQGGILRHVVQGDAQSLPIRGDCADVVVSGFMLQHTTAPRRVFAEWARVLRAGGRLALAAWVGSEQWPVQDVFTEELDRAGAAQVASSRPAFEEIDSPDKLATLARAADLEVDQLRVAPLDWQPSVGDVLGQLSTMRGTGRRFATLETTLGQAVLERAAERLDGLTLASPEDVCHLHALKPDNPVTDR